MDYLEQYRHWLEHAPVSYRDELSAMAGNEEALKGCFGAELAFGTAGIRGIMGLGCNRLNEFTVRRTAQGIAKWLNGTDLPKTCAIGYDSRHNSRSYAEICAAALALLVAALGLRGPEIGETLRKLLFAVMDGRLENETAALTAAAARSAEKI